jgi:hypothetical protein
MCRVPELDIQLPEIGTRGQSEQDAEHAVQRGFRHGDAAEGEPGQADGQ